VIAIVILTQFMDFVVLFKLAIVAIFPHVATAGIEERWLPPLYENWTLPQGPSAMAAWG
jgi:hypothetical protein